MQRKANLIISEFENPLRFSVELNYEACFIRYSNIRKLEDCQNPKFLKLREIINIFDREIAIEFLKTWIIQLNEYFNLKNEGKLTGRQAEEVAMNILDDYSFLNLPELTILFRNIRKGRYGQIYGRISGLEIYRWVQDFAIERSRAIIKQQEEARKKQGENMPIHERAKLIKQALLRKPKGDDNQTD